MQRCAIYTIVTQQRAHAPNAGCCSTITKCTPTINPTPTISRVVTHNIIIPTAVRRGLQAESLSPPLYVLPLACSASYVRDNDNSWYPCLCYSVLSLSPFIDRVHNVRLQITTDAQAPVGYPWQTTIQLCYVAFLHPTWDNRNNLGTISWRRLGYDSDHAWLER